MKPRSIRTHLIFFWGLYLLLVLFVMLSTHLGAPEPTPVGVDRMDMEPVNAENPPILWNI